MSALVITHPPGRAGLDWLIKGWRLFVGGAIPWMGMAAISLLAATFISMVPYVGSAAVEWLSPFLVAGFMLASRAAGAKAPFSFYLFVDGFREAPKPLAVIGTVYLVASLLSELAMRALGGEGFQLLFELAQTRPETIDPAQAELILHQALPAMLAGLLILTPALLATWFAPALVLFDGFSPLKALYWSLWACAVNWRPMLIYGLWLSLVAVVAILIPFGLGLLVFVPVALASTYSAYTDLFVSTAEIAEPAPVEDDA